MRTKVLFLGCNSIQVPYLKVLKSKGYKIIGVDLNKNAPGKEYCDVFYNFGYDDYEALLSIGKEESFQPSDKVFTAAAQFANKGNAYFCSKFGIEHPKEKIIDFCLDKVAYYNFFKKNNIPLPRTTFIDSKDHLKEEISLIKSPGWFYLKSDYSKNPNYVYRIHSDNMPYEEIFWGRDRYLRNHYILQEEYPGVSLRLNLYGNRFNVIDFNSSLYTYDYHDMLLKFGTINTLRSLLVELGIDKWLIKFDIILNEEGYVVLDIGLDPPSRMKKKAIEQEINFENLYIDHYLNNQINYPSSLD